MTDHVEITTLSNGLRVISEHMPRLQTASLGVWVDVGTRYEPAEVNGVAHLLEHMAFKGTERRSARAIAEEIERVGGSLNAYTSREHTAYYARILAGDVELAADILADILRHSTFDPAELEKERHVVLQEIGQVRDTPDDLVFDLLQEASYPDQPMGRAILGPEEIVRGMSREALMGYMARHYGPHRLVFAGADGFLVPSLYEPCGLTQLYALRYGAVPVVRETGGLKDTVQHFDGRAGNGSVFKDADVNGLGWALGELLAWYRDPAAWARVVANGMAADFSWRHQAPEYERLYARTVALPPG